MLKASIIGASGYAGGELLRLLLNHGGIEIAHLVGFSSAGEDIDALFPYLEGMENKKISSLDMDILAKDSDIVFMAMPHGQAVEPAMAALAKGKKVIDIGADFRFKDANIYEKWYKVKHGNHELSASAVYGLPELYRNKIKGASLVANPGCYPTASILALYPLLKAGIIKQDSIIIDAKSGISGAGRKPSSGNIYCEAAESLKAYNVAHHRHTPEIEQILSDVSGMEQLISFTPHLAPMSRGILVTVYAQLNCPAQSKDLNTLFQMTYKDEKFVKVHKEGNWPQTKWATGTNFCHLALTYDSRTKRVIITGAIDNLIKGAAGQAIQNMNLMFGLPEHQGLEFTPVFP